MTTSQNPIKVFLSYAHEDEPLLRKLETHLSSLKRQGLISIWYDRQIVPGTNWAKVIDQRLEQASIILLLVSADFLASDYCYEVEMKRVMARHEAGSARVIPIVVRPCDWSHAPFAMIQSLPRDGKAVTAWDNRDLAWSEVIVGIRQTIEDLHLGTVPARPRQEMESGSKQESSADRFSVDVCIVCALAEEARAFLEVVRQQCNVDFEEHVDSRYKYDYRLTTIKNDKGELLTLHISWLPRYGPQEMALHLPRILERYQPRAAIMTGICAGDAQHVQLGDLVVAERIFTYDNGKFTLDEQGRSVHLHDTMTYQLSADTLQFLGLFDNWKPLVMRLKRPLHPPEQRKRRKIACHIKAMASGNAVRADHPFEDVQAPIRGTVAIDIEGAAFGLVMSHHPLIRWLIVKGVCDYADQNKNDVYHDYAARASALYALSFIRAYVTNERLPRPDGTSPSSRAEPSGVRLECATEEIMPSCDGPLPTNAAYWIHQGDALCHQKSYEAALDAYEQAIVLDKQQSRAYRKKGDLLFYLLSRYAGAIAVFDQASQLNPQFADVHAKKASISEISQKRGQEALDSYQRVIDLEPRNSEAHNCKGKVFFYLNRYEEALAAYEDAIALNPNFTEAYYGKSDALSRLGRTSEAQQAYKKADELAKGD